MPDDALSGDENSIQGSFRSAQRPLLIRLVRATGIVSSDTAAQYVLVGISVAGILFAIFLFMQSSKPAIPPSELEQGRTVDQSQFSQFAR